MGPMQARYVIGPDDIIAYADINVDYRSKSKVSAALLPAAFAERHLTRTSPMKREILCRPISKTGRRRHRL